MPCPTGCGRSVPPEKLMCPVCWRTVPKPLQDDVYTTWRVYRRFTGMGQSTDRTRAREAYVEARDAAIGSVP